MKLLSTKQNSGQMPMALVGIKKWDAATPRSYRASSPPPLTPNGRSSASIRLVISGFWLAGVLGWMQVSPPPIFPRPLEILSAWETLFENGSLLPALSASFILDLEAVTIATLLSLVLSYLVVITAARPLPIAISKFRYLGLTGFTFAFGQVWSGHDLKLSLLVFGMTTFTVTGMLSVISEIPQEAYDHVRTLRMSPWRCAYEVVVLGTADRMLDVVRQNGAMGWVMLVTAEALVRTEGGLGVLLYNENHALRLDTIYALQATIFGVAIAMDFALSTLGNTMFSYARLTRAAT